MLPIKYMAKMTVVKDILKDRSVFEYRNEISKLGLIKLMTTSANSIQNGDRGERTVLR